MSRPTPTPNGAAAHAAEIPLDPACEAILRGLAARRYVLQKEILDPFNAEVDAAHRAIERLCGVPAGAIGTTHELIAGDPPTLWRKPAADQPAG
jgi:hypothetical protein